MTLDDRRRRSARPRRCWPATIGLVQNDIKRVLAYSTVSQLGYMFLAMGVGAFARRHLPPLHARVLQGAALPRLRRGDSRAGRRAGPAAHGRPADGELPITYWTFLIGALAIAGVPRPGRVLQQGRDPVPDLRERPPRCSGSSASLTSLLTAIYMFRLVFLTFHGEPAHRAARAHAAHGATAGRHATASATRHGAPARRAAGHGDRADRAGRRLGARRLRRRARTRSAAATASSASSSRASRVRR